MPVSICEYTQAFLGMESLGCRLCVFPTLEDTAEQFPKLRHQFTLSPKASLPFLALVRTLGFVSPFNFSHSGDHCGFKFAFP